MEPGGLTSLPVEVIHHISRYLTVQDVLACSLTCHYLRTTLNNNYVWKQYLPRGISCLEIKEQQVTPALHIDENLSSLCESRQHYGRKTHLINNWREGHCVQFRSTSEFSLRSGVFNRTKGKGDVIFDDRFIFFGRFINDFESDGIEVWDISNIPVCHTVFRIKYVNYDCFFIIDSYLVVVERIKVFVYRINLPEKDFPLVFSFLVTEDIVTLNQRVEQSGRDDERCVTWDHSVVKHYLISSKCGQNVLIHIWDIRNASKIGSIRPPIECFSANVHLCNEKNIYFEIRLQTSSVNYLSILDIEKMQFSDHMFSYNISSYMLIFNNYVILFKNAVDPNQEGWYDTVCRIFDFNSSLKLQERRFDNATKNYMLGSVTIVNGRFVILCNDGFHVVDALTLETVDMIKCDNTRFITKQIVLFESFVIIASANCRDKLELWDINRKKKLSITLNQVYTGHLYLDRLFTKLVIMNYNYVSVVHFW